MKLGFSNPSSISLYRAQTVANDPITLRRKRCACGKVVTARQLQQQGGCDRCAQERALTRRAA